MKKNKITNLLLALLSLTFTGCTFLDAINTVVELPQLPVIAEKEIREYTQKKITTAMAASEKSDPETYNLKNKQLYECTADDLGRGTPGKYFDKAYVISGLNGSVVLHQSNPNLHFSTKGKVANFDDIGFRLVTSNYKFDWSVLDGGRPEWIGAVYYQCELSKRKDLFHDNINGTYDITYAMSYDTIPLAITTTIDPETSAEYKNSQTESFSEDFLDFAMFDYALFGFSGMLELAPTNVGMMKLFSKIEETKEYNKAKSFSCDLVEGEKFKIGTWPMQSELKGGSFEVRVTKNFVYFKNNEMSKKINRGLYEIRIQNIDDLLFLFKVDKETKDILQKAVLDCGV